LKLNLINKSNNKIIKLKSSIGLPILVKEKKLILNFVTEFRMPVNNSSGLQMTEFEFC